MDRRRLNEGKLGWSSAYSIFPDKRTEFLELASDSKNPPVKFLKTGEQQLSRDLQTGPD